VQQKVDEFPQQTWRGLLGLAEKIFRFGHSIGSDDGSVRGF
jgi:hypothetical protein